MSSCYVNKRCKPLHFLCVEEPYPSILCPSLKLLVLFWQDHVYLIALNALSPTESCWYLFISMYINFNCLNSLFCFTEALNRFVLMPSCFFCQCLQTVLYPVIIKYVCLLMMLVFLLVSMFPWYHLKNKIIYLPWCNKIKNNLIMQSL